MPQSLNNFSKATRLVSGETKIQTCGLGLKPMLLTTIFLSVKTACLCFKPRFSTVVKT